MLLIYSSKLVEMNGSRFSYNAAGMLLTSVRLWSKFILYALRSERLEMFHLHCRTKEYEADLKLNRLATELRYSQFCAD